ILKLSLIHRKDSFITHRAFCDALAEENTKAKNGVMPTMSPNLQAQPPELMMPIGTSIGSLPVGVSDFDNHDIKNPLKGFAYDLMPTSLRSHTMAGTMLSSPTAATLFSSGTFPSGYNGLSDDAKTGRPAIASAHMSATALLQKAAQVGATAAGGSAGATQRGFVSGMAGPDRHWVQAHEMGVNGGAFANQFFDIGMGGGSAVSDAAGVLPSNAGVFVGGGGHGHGLLKALEHASGGGGSLMQGGSGRSGVRYGGGGTGDVTTLDFLGVSGARSVAAMGLHEQQQQQQHQGMEFGGVGRKRLLGLHPFQQQQQLSNGQGASMEKVVWDVLSG
ncbi:zinc finger protein GAI-ASSOCIATED FACTOR 1-like, partial [Phoenix dactylifera]|uniref:Zinc finger protein GAI-ASSOCIATED FACTOR 1-like n=1 Tax=Phoenix dactylifera TaxID=42345 RepID=A0A8B8ZX09_PHODC